MLEKKKMDDSRSQKGAVITEAPHLFQLQSSIDPGSCSSVEAWRAASIETLDSEPTSSISAQKLRRLQLLFQC